MLLSEALVLFERQLRANGRSIHSINQARRHIGLLGTWLVAEGRSLDVANLDPRTVAEFMGSPQALNRADGRRKLATSANALRSSLKGFCAFACAAGLVPADAGRLLRRAVVGEAAPRALSEAQQERLVATLDAAKGWEARRDRLAFLLMLRCGLRLGSVIALDTTDFEPVEGVLAVRLKGNRRERVFVPKDLCGELGGFLVERRASAVFTSQSWKRLSPRHLQRRFSLVAKAAELPAGTSCHTLRHSFATALLRKTGNVELVRRALGHRSASSTAIYLRVEDSELRAAVGA